MSKWVSLSKGLGLPFNAGPTIALTSRQSPELRKAWGVITIIWVHKQGLKSIFMLDLNQNLTLGAVTGIHAATLHNVRFDELFIQKLSKYPISLKH